MNTLWFSYTYHAYTMVYHVHSTVKAAPAFYRPNPVSLVSSNILSLLWNHLNTVNTYIDRGWVVYTILGSDRPRGRINCTLILHTVFIVYIGVQSWVYKIYGPIRVLFIITYQSAHRPKSLSLRRFKIQQNMRSGQILVDCAVSVRQDRLLFHLPIIPNIFHKSGNKGVSAT